MPHTVPNKPTKGDTEPTVARKAKPLCKSRCTASTARCICMEIHSSGATWVSKPDWGFAASKALEAMNRKGLRTSRSAMPFATLSACQKLAPAARQCASKDRKANALRSRMYQLPQLIKSRRNKTAFVTASDANHNAITP
jgi:hypothetical protein